MRAVLATDTGLIKVVDIVKEKDADGNETEKITFPAQWGTTQSKTEEIHSLRARPDHKDQVVVGRAGGRVEVVHVGSGAKLVSLTDAKGTKATDRWAGVEIPRWAPDRAIGWYTGGRGVVCTLGMDESTDVDANGGTESKTTSSAEIVKEFSVNTTPIGTFHLHPTLPQSAIGGKNVDLRLVEVENGKTVWTARNVRNDFLDMQVPVWVADLAFLPDDAHRIAVATGYHQLRIYDIKAQRRPVADFELKELPNAFTCLIASSDPNVIAVGDTLGNAVEIDLRNKKIKGSYRGIAGSLRAIGYGPDGSTIVTASLDRFLRVYSTAAPLRRLKHKIYLKQRVTGLVLMEPPPQLEQVKEEKIDSDDEAPEASVDENEVEIKDEDEEEVDTNGGDEESEDDDDSDDDEEDDDDDDEDDSDEGNLAKGGILDDSDEEDEEEVGSKRKRSPERGRGRGRGQRGGRGGGGERGHNKRARREDGDSRGGDGRRGGRGGSERGRGHGGGGRGGDGRRGGGGRGGGGRGGGGRGGGGRGGGGRGGGSRGGGGRGGGGRGGGRGGRGGRGKR